MSTTRSALFYWLVSGIYLLSFTFYLCSFLCLLHLLYCIFYRNRSLNLEMSNFLKLILICWSLMLASGLPHIIFMSFRVFLIILSFSDGSEDIPLTPTRAVFWSQVWTQCFIPAITFSVLFLTLDRLFCIATPIEYNIRRKDVHLRVAIGCLATLYLAIFYSFLCELPLPELTDCIAFACTIKKTGSKGFIISKIVGGVLIILSGLAFLLKIQKRKMALAAASSTSTVLTHSHAVAASNSKANRVTVLMIASELLLNFVPQLIVLTLEMTTGIVPSAHIGPHNLFLSSLEALISALTFKWIFKKKLSAAGYQQQSRETPAAVAFQVPQATMTMRSRQANQPRIVAGEPKSSMAEPAEQLRFGPPGMAHTN